MPSDAGEVASPVAAGMASFGPAVSLGLQLATVAITWQVFILTVQRLAPSWVRWCMRAACLVRVCGAAAAAVLAPVDVLPVAPVPAGMEHSDAPRGLGMFLNKEVSRLRCSWCEQAG